MTKWCPFSTNEEGGREYSCNEKCGLYDEENQRCSIVTISRNLESIESLV